MINEKVKNPFWCRMSQFEEGRRQLCIGVSFDVVKRTEYFTCIIGKNERFQYKIKGVDCVLRGQVWNNPKGKQVVIIPLDYFEKIDTQPDAITVEKTTIKETIDDIKEKAPEVFQEALFDD